jgi:hypothetical protein
MKYLVVGSQGPGWATPEEAAQLLKEVVVPGLDALTKLETDKKILAGGVEIGDRAVTFIAEAASNEALDRMLREIPLWVRLKWRVTPIESFESRAAEERRMLTRLRPAKR